MNDLISRQAVINKAIMIPVARIVTEDKVLWRKAVFVEDIEALPSVDVTTMRSGKWIIRETAFEDTEVKCSECGFKMLVNQPGNGLLMVSELLYCPNCGARMEESDECNI